MGSVGPHSLFADQSPSDLFTPRALGKLLRVY